MKAMSMKLLRISNNQRTLMSNHQCELSLETWISVLAVKINWCNITSMSKSNNLFKRQMPVKRRKTLTPKNLLESKICNKICRGFYRGRMSLPFKRTQMKKRFMNLLIPCKGSLREGLWLLRLLLLHILNKICLCNSSKKRKMLDSLQMLINMLIAIDELSCLQVHKQRKCCLLKQMLARKTISKTQHPPGTLRFLTNQIQQDLHHLIWNGLNQQKN